MGEKKRFPALSSSLQKIFGHHVVEISVTFIKAIKHILKCRHNGARVDFHRNVAVTSPEKLSMAHKSDNSSVTSLANQDNVFLAFLQLIRSELRSKSASRWQPDTGIDLARARCVPILLLKLRGAHCCATAGVLLIARHPSTGGISFDVWDP